MVAIISNGDFLPNSLQHYFTAKLDFLILRVRFKVSFYSLENPLPRIPHITVLSGWLPIRCVYFILPGMKKDKYYLKTIRVVRRALSRTMLSGGELTYTTISDKLMPFVIIQLLTYVEVDMACY